MNKSSKEIYLGTLLSYGVLAINCIVNLVLTPLMISKIGDAQYGVYKTVLSMISYMSVCKLGFGNATVKYIAEYRLKNEKKKEKEFLTTIKWLNTFACILVIGLGVIISLFIPTMFSESFTKEEIVLAEQLFILLIVSTVFSVIVDIYDAVISAYEEFIFQKVVDILRSLIRVVLLICVLFIKPMAVLLTIVEIVVNILLLIVDVIKTKKMNIRITYIYDSYRQIEWKAYFPMLIFSAMVLLNSLVNQLLWSTDSIIIGMRLNSIEAAVYSVGSNISSLFVSASIVVSNMLLPRAVQLVEEKSSKDKLTSFLVEAARFQSVIIFGILCAYCILGRQFIQLWLGEGYLNAWSSSLYIMVGSIFMSLVVSGHSILKAKNTQGFYVIVYLAIFLVNSVLTYLIVPYKGIDGAAMMTFLSFAVGNVFLIWPYYHFKIGLNIITMLKSISKIFVIFAILLAGGLGITKLFVVDTWLRFVIACLIYIVIYALLVWIIFLNRDEKRKLLKQINNEG